MFRCDKKKFRGSYFLDSAWLVERVWYTGVLGHWWVAVMFSSGFICG